MDKQYFTRSYVFLVMLTAIIGISIVPKPAYGDETAQIVVHAVNPEGVEIGSIMGLNEYGVPYVRIYKDGVFVGYSIENEGECNQSITVPSGNHTIAVRFNGITKIQNISIDENVTRSLVFFFEREKTDISWKGDEVSAQISNSYGCNDPYIGDVHGVDESDVLKAVTQIRDDECASFSAYAKLHLKFNSRNYEVSSIAEINGLSWCEGCEPSMGSGISSPFARTKIWRRIYEFGEYQDDWRGGAGGAGRDWELDEPIPAHGLLFEKWFIQSKSSSDYPNVYLGYGNYPVINKTAETLISPVDANRIYGTEYKTINLDCPFIDVGVYANNGREIFSQSGSVDYLKISSVPYDMTGEGIICQGIEPPTASFTYSPEEPNVFEEVTFDASSSYDSNGQIVSYEWDFGDGETAMEVEAAHSYSEARDYTVELTVTDNDGWKDHTRKQIDYVHSNLVPEDKGPPEDQYQGCEGDPVTVVNGNVYLIITDLETNSPGMPFRFRRTYNSISNEDSPLGFGWTHEYNVSLDPPQDDTSPAIITDWDDQGIVFIQETPETFAPLPGEHSELTQTADGYVWKKKSGLTYTFDSSGRLQSSADRNGNSMAFAYDENDRLSTITDTADRSYSVMYNDEGHISELSGPSGRKVEYTYDSQGNLTQVIGPAGTVTSYEYNDTHDVHNLTKQTIGDQFVFNYAYDENDQCIESTGPDGKLRVALDYQPDENRTAVTDAKGEVHTKYCNSHGRIVRLVHADGTEEAFTWDADLNRTGVVRQDGSEWQYEYDDRGNLTKTIDPAGGEVIMIYDADDNLASLTDERGNTTQYQYDDNGNVTSIAQADDSSLTFTYNDRGQVLTATDAGGDVTNYNYDKTGNLISVTDPEGNTVTYAYDIIGRRISSTDAEGNTTRYAYDAMNRVTSVTDALSGEVETQHETAGLGSLTDQDRNTTQFQYDAVDQLTEIIDPLGNTKSFGYDANGNLASRTDFKGEKTDYEYDEMDQLTKIDYPAGTDVTFEYDAVGRVTGMTNAIGKSAYAYDSAARLTFYTNGFDKTVSYTYDAAGNLATLTYPGDKSVSYTYDERNRLTQIEDWAGRSTTYAYDNTGRLVQTTLPNGTRVEYEYDAAGKLTALRNLRSDDSVIASFEYTFDGNGNIIGANADQPLDLVLQTQEVNTTIGPDNRIASSNGTAFAYDNNGNLTSDGSTTYEYDHEDRLTRVVTPDSGTWEYLYDGAGRRVQSMHDSEVRRFLLDPRGMTNVLAEYDGDGNLTAYYVHGLGLAYKVDASGDTYYYHYNYTGHTVAMTDRDEDVVNKYAYLPFGELAAKDETVDNPFRYVGKYGVMDEGNGLLFMRARYYQYKLGQFITKDPIAYTDGTNLSSYVENNPLTYVDPLGLCKDNYGNGKWLFKTWHSVFGGDLRTDLDIITAGWQRILERRERWLNSKLGQTLKIIALLPSPYWTGIELNWDEETGELKPPSFNKKDYSSSPMEKLIDVWIDPARPLW